MYQHPRSTILISAARKMITLKVQSVVYSMLGSQC
eukprot:COSAG02_NODE_41887_length_390_cov_0.525773_1_plen_34_part_01